MLVEIRWMAASLLPGSAWIGQNVLAVATLLLSIVALRKELRDRKEALTASSARARQQYNADLRAWTDRCLGAFAEATQMLEQGAADESRLGEVSSRFSALADQGRLFFPNVMSGVAPADHHPAESPGYRPRILDWLVFSFRILRSVAAVPDGQAAAIIFAMQRAFTTDAQEVLAPLNLFSTMEDLEKLLGTASGIVDTSQSHQCLRAARLLLESRGAKQHPRSPGV